MHCPLVSILIPAYNAEATLAETLRSAVAQTWHRKEIIVIDDGSSDRTAEIARSFASGGVKVVSTVNRGLSAAVNAAYRECQGDYIQELDADDLMSSDKIELQMAVLLRGGDDLMLASSPWAYFYFRPQRAKFVPTALHQDLTPVEWLLRKMGRELHMQNATWLMSRRLAEAAGPWKEDLRYDQDGEYYARAVTASSGIRFVPDGKVFYRTGNRGRLSFIGKSQPKRESLLVSMKLHVQYIRSLEDSARVRAACLTYLQDWFWNFYPDRPDLVTELQGLAAELGGRLAPPTFRRHYGLIQAVLGLQVAKQAQAVLPTLKSSLIVSWDKAMHRMEGLSGQEAQRT
jgi:glycosyltransferase involved in cell wall biosynthesis